MGKMSSFSETTNLALGNHIPILQTSGSTVSNMKMTIEALRDTIFSNIGTGASIHNSIYRGKNLGTYVTAEQYATINTGDFNDLFIGDYWTVNDRVYRIAAFDYWYNKGDTACTKHHVVLVPYPLFNAKINNTNITTGGYVGSDFYTGNNSNTGLSDAKSIINAAFSGHILSHREYLCNAVSNGYPSSGGWYDSTVELMNEPMVYGSYIFAGANSNTNIPSLYTIDNSQLPLFMHRPDLVFWRGAYWLRDIISESSFADISDTGYASHYTPSNVLGIRPAFGICYSGL